MEYFFTLVFGFFIYFSFDRFREKTNKDIENLRFEIDIIKNHINDLKNDKEN